MLNENILESSDVNYKGSWYYKEQRKTEAFTIRFNY